MASITELISFGNLAKSVAKDAGSQASDTVEAVAKAAQLFKKAKAISSTANKYVVRYPVLITTRISDVKTAVAITKQVELDCARFIILAAGLRPLIGGKGNEINNQLNSIFTEESLKNLNLTITKASDDEFYSAEHYLNNVLNTVSVDKFRKTSRFINSVEMIDSDASTDKGDPDPGNDTDSFAFNSLSQDEIEYAKKNAGINFEMKDNKKIQINGREYDPKNKTDLAFLNTIANKIKKDYNSMPDYKFYENAAARNETLKKITKQGPTIIDLKFKVMGSSGSLQEVSVPLAVKASLIYVDSSDCVDVLNRSKTFSSGLKTALKIISGEICFTDWLFNLKEAQKDVEREKELGYVPWYRNLLSGKNKWKTKNLLEVMKVQSDFIKGKTKDDMPMCTIIVTEDELVQVGCRLSKFLQDRKLVNGILDEYMLLCFGIVDNTNDMVYMFYAGEDDYRAIDINKMGVPGDDKASNDVASKLLTMLGKSIDYNNRH